MALRGLMHCASPLMMTRSRASVGTWRPPSLRLQTRTAARFIRRDLTAVRRERDCTRLRSLFGTGDKEKNGESNNKNPFSNFSELLKTAQDAQVRATAEAQKVQEELSKVEFEGYDDDELVRVVISGNQEPKSVELTESLLELELEEMERRIVDAMQEAHAKSVSGMKDRMRQLYSDLGFPMPPQQ